MVTFPLFGAVVDTIGFQWSFMVGSGRGDGSGWWDYLLAGAPFLGGLVSRLVQRLVISNVSLVIDMMRMN